MPQRATATVDEQDTNVVPFADTGAEPNDGPHFDAVDIPLDASYASADDFFHIAPKNEELWIPEMGKKVLIRRISGFEADGYRASIITGKGPNVSLVQKNMRAKLACLALGNPDGSRMFKDSDVHRIATWPGIVLERIYDRAVRVNGLTDQAMDDEKND